MRMSKGQIKQRVHRERREGMDHPYDGAVDDWIKRREAHLQQAKRKKLKVRRQRGHTR